MIILLLQWAYLLCLLPVCFYICFQIQGCGRKAVELLAKRKGSSKNKTIWISMIVLTLFQPALFILFGHLGMYVFKVIFR